MDAFFIYVNMGINHVLDIKGYDHVLFLLALISPYAFKDWKRILFLVSIFTVGHTLALVLSVYRIPYSCYNFNYGFICFIYGWQNY